MLLALLVATVARAACPAAASSSDIAARFDAAEASYGKGDMPAFTKELDVSALMLPCLSDPVSPAFSARYHRNQGLRAVNEKDNAAAERAFAAARRLDPKYEFPATVVPAGHLAGTLYAAAKGSSPKVVKVPEPATGKLSFDGTDGLARPAEQPTLVQYRDGSGSVSWSFYAAATDTLPGYPTK